ncbi:MAG TPA: apolipoprotein N-acyltransferase [Chlamydiales bacterium]|nr:apolipoprotein N-acyltransferase [Chlamydiales bacterium]
MNYILIAVSFLLVAFGQPAWIRGFGVLSAAFGFALFWRAMLDFPRQRDRFFLSVAWFACVQGLQLSWMTTMDYMGPFIIVVYLFLILAMGVQFGLLSLLFNRPITAMRAVGLAGCWTIFEWLRLFFLCGFTWNPIGLSLVDSSYSLQFAAVWGIFGLSFWVILVNVAALVALIEKSVKQIAIWASLALLPYAFGLVQQKWVEWYVPFSGHLNVALVQTGLFPEQKEFARNAPDAYIPPLDQWARILKVFDETKPVDLIVFPEAALPLSAHSAGYDLSVVKRIFDESDFPPLRDPYARFDWKGWRVSNAFLVQTLANHFKSHIIVGLDDADFEGNYNAAFHFRPHDAPYERYEKRILAPIAEYVPLRQWGFFSRFVAQQFGIYNSFDPGRCAKVFKATIPIGVSICLEETFSNLIRELRVKGAELFVNLTNDVWFPRSKLPRQHFDHGRVRAAENGVYLLRACNTGVTGVIDCFGQPIDQLPVSEEKASVLYLTLPIRSYSTLYTWWGDSAILGISAVGLVLQFLFQKKKLP